MAMDKDELVIEVVGTTMGARLTSFLTVAENALGILSGLARNIAPHRPIDWRISAVSLGSPLRMAIRGLAEDEPASVAQIVNAYLSGVRQLDTSEGLPDHWRPEELVRAKAIAAVPNREDVDSVGFSSNGETVRATQRIAAHVDAVLREVEDAAALDGRLEAISVHSGWTFSVYDDLTGERIPCVFTREMFELARDALGHRVAIQGIGRYDRVGHIKSVKVESIVRLPDGPQLSDIAEAPRIDITGGVESSEYIRGLRDE